MSNKLSTQPYKGTKDYYPEDMAKREYLFSAWKSAAKLFGYEEYDTPLLEEAQMYRAKSGDELANTQLYNFVDKGGREVAIRPEMTPSLARIIAAKVNVLPRPIRWFNIGRYYRYEKPQRGRTREFFQLNIDIFGIEDIKAEAEIFSFISTVMDTLKAPKDTWRVYVNNRYLVDYVFEKVLKVKDDLKRPLARAIDNYTKVKREEFPGYLKEVGLDPLQIKKLMEFLEYTLEDLVPLKSQSRGAKELLSLFDLCKEIGLENFEFKPYIMRGLDYYTGTVIEMFDVGGDKNPRALFGGGRYDDLLDIFGKPKLPAFGIGWGSVTMLDYLETYGLFPEYKTETKYFIALADKKRLGQSFKAASSLRAKGERVEVQLEEGQLGKQFKYASKKGFEKVIIAEENGSYTIKDMKSGEQGSYNLK